ncbi:hypothetical protein EVAR_95073_1 [Eumeta japonica]|uniref:Uncharacterized protein n=1 Tax=Eumeta variegata TaxID=151549 RepID=A0A4C1W6C1_EUMVA|nr:hypothetical protein EVAR_95073_1 [Eumeta japonica]
MLRFIQQVRVPVVHSPFHQDWTEGDLLRRRTKRNCAISCVFIKRNGCNGKLKKLTLFDLINERVRCQSWPSDGSNPFSERENIGRLFGVLARGPTRGRRLAGRGEGGVLRVSKTHLWGKWPLLVAPQDAGRARSARAPRRFPK